jgi:hypothetical protein
MSAKHDARILLPLALALASCGDEGSALSVESYLDELPGWNAFCPPVKTEAPAPTDDAPMTYTETVDVKNIDDEGKVSVTPKVTYSCQSQPYSMTDTPQKIVMYSPDVEVMWPGALIQGKSHRDGLGSLLPLTIAERNQIKVSIPALKNADNFREVDPTQADVAQAIGAMVGNATVAGLSTPSTIAFDMRSFQAESEFALSTKMSAKYLGFSMSASGDFSRNAAETTITAQFYQKMFEVVVEPPQTPTAFFSEAFTPEKLKEQEELGKIGKNNIPVYVSNVVYGRMMMFSLTSTSTEQEIRAALNAAYNGIASSGSVSLSAKHKSILQESKLAVSSLGGDAEASIAMIRSGDWSQYFTKDAPLSSAAPLSYTMRNLSDGSIATVGETTEYNITTCTAKAASDLWHFLPEVIDDQPPVASPARVAVGDFDGDGKDDLVWNHAGVDNTVYAARSDGDGGYTFDSPVVHPVSGVAGGWANHALLVGDVTGDNKQDLVWNLLMVNQSNSTCVGLSSGSSFDLSGAVQQMSSGDWSGYTAQLADVNGDGKQDLVWNKRSTSANEVTVALAQGNGVLAMNAPKQTYPVSGNWTPYVLHAGDSDGDGNADLIWVHDNGYVRLWNSAGDGTFKQPSPAGAQLFPGAGTSRLADVDGDKRADLIYNKVSFDATSSESVNTVSVALGKSDGTFAAATTPQSHPDAKTGSTTDFTAYRLLTGDVNGDGKADLIWNLLDGEEQLNRTYVGLSKGDGTFDLSLSYEDHPAARPWSTYRVLTGDVDGDGRTDLIWNLFSAAGNHVLVALARPK